MFVGLIVCVLLVRRLHAVLARRFWSGWKHGLMAVGSETVVGWHRAGFKLYWRAISRARRVIGRKRISKVADGISATA
jgi:hypothetical protein